MSIFDIQRLIYNVLYSKVDIYLKIENNLEKKTNLRSPLVAPIINLEKITRYFLNIDVNALHIFGGFSQMTCVLLVLAATVIVLNSLGYYLGQRFMITPPVRGEYSITLLMSSGGRGVRWGGGGGGVTDGGCQMGVTDEGWQMGGVRWECQMGGGVRWGVRDGGVRWGVTDGG